MNASEANAIKPPTTRFWLWSLLSVVGLALALFAFFRFNPSEHSFFPRCVFHSVSGWNCPGCGGQRALHHLLHGNFAAALQHNALFVVLLPLAIWSLAQTFWNRCFGSPKIGLFKHHLWPWVLCITVIAFGVLRNLPGFGWLRP
jgi:Protein of unknown function (DUF2752).